MLVELVEDVVGAGLRELGQAWAGDRQRPPPRGDGHEDGGRLHPQLAPGQPDHLSTSRDGAPRGAVRGTSGAGQAGRRTFHVRQHEVLQAELGDGPRRVEHRAARCARRGWSAGRCGWPTPPAGRPAASRRRASWPGEPVVGVEQRLDVTGEPHLGVDEHHQVVADPLEVGDEVRGEHDAELLLGDGLHEAPGGTPPRERVEARDRLVEDQQLGALGQAEGEGELGALPPGQPTGALGRVEAEPVDPRAGQVVVPARVEVGAEPQVVADAEPGVGRGVLGDEPDLGELGGVGGGPAAADLDGPGGRARAARPPGSAAWSSGAVRPDQADDPPGRDRRRVQSFSAHRRP